MKQYSSLSDCLAWLEQLHPVEIELGLSRVREVASRLGLLSPSANVVTIAGTNGKGSATAMLEASLTQLNVSVGCYTSPHMFEFNERVRVNGDNVADQELVDALHAIEAVRADISLSYFEYTTLAALYIFAKRQVEVMVLEVGLGGRLDAVNIIDADIAVITSIGLDHQDWLGHTRSDIAREKLGVARKGKRLLITESDPPDSLFEDVDTLGAKVCWLGQEVAIEPKEEGFLCRLADTHTVVMPVPSSLSQESVLTALQVVQWLALDINALDYTRLANTSLVGRFQQLPLACGTAIADVAHNPAAIERLVAQLLTRFPDREFILCYATMADKDYREVISLLQRLPISRWVLPKLTVARALPPQNIEEILQPFGDIVCLSTNQLAPLFGELRNNQCLLICGSFYTVAAGLEAYQSRKG